MFLHNLTIRAAQGRFQAVHHLTQRWTQALGQHPPGSFAAWNSKLKFCAAASN